MPGTHAFAILLDELLRIFRREDGRASRSTTADSGSGVVPVITGPTGAGKSDLVLEVSRALKGEFPVEIISADAFLVYRGMDVGTAKPSSAVRAEFPHHVIDLVEPSEYFGAGRFVEVAERAIGSVREKNRVPIVVGGSMLYLWALTEGLHASPGRDQDLRMSGDSREELLARLARHDPAAARNLQELPLHRIVRAIEIVEATGLSMAEWSSSARGTPRFTYRFFKLVPDRKKLYESINRRVDSMMEAGLVAEVEQLRARGIGPASESQRAIGYREIHRFLDGELGRDEAVALVQRNTRRYAKRQMTWMRHHFEEAVPL